MKLAIAQLNPTIGALTSNAQAILQAAQTAASQGADLLLTPELSLCGYPPRDLLLRSDWIQRLEEQLQAIATQLPPGLAALVGSVTPNPNTQLGQKPLLNSMVLLQDGHLQARYHKRLLPTYDVFDEDRYFEPGQARNILNFQGFRLGISICEDLWNDEEFWGQRRYGLDPIADLAGAGVDLIINLSASPYSMGKQGLRESLIHHASLRHGVPILYVNQVGGNDDLIFDGGSLACDRQGTMVLRAASFEDDLQMVELDPLKRELQPARIHPRPTHPEEELWQALVLGVRDYARKCGFTQILLGLSGGIDSALVAAIAAAAVGPQNVLGVLMPSPYSSDHSISDAEALGASLGIQTQLLPIQPMMLSFEDTLAHLFSGRAPDVTEENLQSRIRGTLLMAIANKFGHLLLTTGNKSEMAVGYCTLYGDMDGGLGAIADLPKTQVYRLCEWLNGPGCELVRTQLGHPTPPNSQPLIPTHILSKPPSAELRPDQVDQDSLPPYDLLDDLLDRIIRQHQSADQLIAAGFDGPTVQKITRLVRIAEFKRKQAPPGLKVTDRAFGTGWRMPIACHWN